MRRYHAAGLIVRAAAISLVLLHHLSDVIVPHAEWARQLWGTGPLGVDLFFALSGFLIGGILLQLGGAIGEVRTLASFWGRRWLRTLPLYYLILVVNILSVVCREGHFADVLRIVAPYWYFGQSFISRSPFFFNEAWSLAVEECFYLLFPLLWSSLIRLRLKPITGYVFCGVGMLFVPGFLRLQLDETVPRMWLYDVCVITIYRLDSIAVGVLAAAVSLYLPRIWSRWRYLGLSLGILVLTLDWRILAHVRFKPPGFMLFWHFVLSCLGCMLVLPWCSLLKTMRPLWFGRLIALVARLSYALYLVHMLLLSGAKALFAAQIKTSPLWSWGVVLLVLTSSFIVAAMLHRWFERPIMALRARWL